MSTLTDAISRVRKAADSQWCLNEELRDSMRVVAKKADYNERDIEEIQALKDLVKHIWVHSGYEDCGRNKMCSDERKLYDALQSEWSLERDE